MRDYSVMRQVLAIVAKRGSGASFSDFATVEPRDEFPSELRRLIDDQLVDGAVSFDRLGLCTTCRTSGLTSEGVEFWRLIENDEVWEIVLSTLSQAGVDVSYPLLKEVCEEIVKRYVTQFIPRLGEPA